MLWCIVQTVGCLTELSDEIWSELFENVGPKGIVENSWQETATAQILNLLKRNFGLE